MRKQLLRGAIAAAVACVVLAPALIWSGQQPQTPLQNHDFYKGPPVFTIGPPMTPQELAAREREKLLSLPSFWNPPQAPIECRPEPLFPKKEDRLIPVDAPLRPLGEEGLTPSERAKLEASRAALGRAAGDEGGRSR
jgi:hypothetical protein